MDQAHSIAWIALWEYNLKFVNEPQPVSNQTQALVQTSGIRQQACLSNLWKYMIGWLRQEGGEGWENGEGRFVVNTPAMPIPVKVQDFQYLSTYVQVICWNLQRYQENIVYIYMRRQFYGHYHNDWGLRAQDKSAILSIPCRLDVAYDSHCNFRLAAFDIQESESNHHTHHKLSEAGLGHAQFSLCRQTLVL